MPATDGICAAFARALGLQAEIRLSAYDGSSAGPVDAPQRILITDRRALNHLATAPGELGLARAYIAGYLEVDGDMFKTLAAVGRATGGGIGAVGRGQRLQVLRDLGPSVLRPVAPPPEEVRPGPWWGLRHSLVRDSRAISHHYDVSNAFYSWILGPSMAYTCAVYPTAEATLEQAQEEKMDLVCRKLDLQPGERLLDVGCGWGSLVLHAAAHYGVRAIGVTLAGQQAEYGQKQIAEMGLSDVAEIRHGDYRRVAETGFDAISSIGLTEHVGARNLGAYARLLGGKLKPQGRLLNHCITRPTTTEHKRSKGFINRYIFPDGELEGVGEIISAIQDAGLEIRHEENLREHYALTLKAWSLNLEDNWARAVSEVGEGRARTWKLYLAGSRLGFEERRIELHQVLAVRTREGAAGVPLRLDFARRRRPVMTA
jgi:cyclopropane-fatty-acyl-phospholipid synthase